ncbi:glycosyltransferase [Ginsengibacter hankyongi]|uniref:Glycosyltransferase n=1 Tax=Ginsengibacter hankyongi TaxID=2607284 RepID=A0A5J5IDA9_9BACT|nr:glycosyltransferase [Ginsengibacter hankyongi]
MPKLSIITVNLNNKAGLQKTMESVFEQTFKDYEYIIIDGGSEDGSKELIETHSDKLSYWISENDNGIYNAMNKGIVRAQGDLIIFLNSGDYYVSNNLLLYASKRIDPGKADVFFCRFIFDNPVSNIIVVSDDSGNTYDWDLQNSNFPHPGTFYKRSVFLTIGVFDENYKILGDFDWNAKALINHRVAFQYVNLITAFFRADGVSNAAHHMNTFEHEKNKILSTYFRPAWLFKYINNHKDKIYGALLEKALGKMYKKKLNRVY